MAVDASPGAGRVLIATGAGPLVSEPSWTRYDDLSACRCAGFDWQRGRQSEFDITNTGTARVFFNDRDGTFSSEDFIGLQAMLQLYNPVTSSWEPVFRGHIDDAHGTPSPGAPELTNVQLDLVDLFDYLSGVKMVVGDFGNGVLPAGRNGIVEYSDGPVDARIEDIGADADLPADLLVVFSGNIDVLESVYGEDDDVLSAMRDAADAEFPGIANIYVDRYGRVVFHGRFARFDPDGTASGAEWTFTRWSAATREDVGTTRAQIREFSYNRPRTRIVNSYLAYPRGIHEDDIPALVRTDPTSISNYGYRGLQAPDLIVKKHKTNGNTGADECALFSDFWVANYAVPRKNIDQVLFTSISPLDDRSSATWAAMCGMDISDVLHLFVDEAGLTDEQFYIEGISGSCRVANPDYDYVTVTPNLSPAAYYTDNVFE
jgi:hypothetical protein